MLTHIGKEKLLILILITATAILRFYNLSYSDYIIDETRTFFFLGKNFRNGEHTQGESRFVFLLNEERPPLQNIISYIPYSIIGNYQNEWAQRIIFSIYSFMAVLMFYFLIKKITNNIIISFISAYLLSINGLIVAYGRIAQYQNLLFFFGFASIYYYWDLIGKHKNLLMKSLLGTLLIAIAFYAHWFAIFFCIPLGYTISKFLKRKDVSLVNKIKLIVANLIFFYSIVAPFFLPYFDNLINGSENVDYAKGIFGLRENIVDKKAVSQFKLYNPYFTFNLYIILGLVGIYISRKNIVFTVWFILSFAIFSLFVTYPGLHFYHIFIPLIVLMAYTFHYILTSRRHLFKILGRLFTTFVLIFLFIQSYLIYLNPEPAYPMEQEKIFGIKTKKISHEDDLRHLTGFPHNRKWSEINKYLTQQNIANNENLTYITNEYHTEFYMDIERGTGPKYYAVGVKKPLSFEEDYKFKPIKNKSTIHKIKDDNGDTIVQIFLVNNE